MTELLQTFSNNLLPILLISGSGFLLGKFLRVEPRPLGRVTFYILSPLLVFNLLTQSQLSPDRIGLMMGYATTVNFLVAGLAYLTGRILRLERSVLTIVVLTTMFSNAGNYGLPLVAFAFGQEALAYASVFFVTNAILLNTVGVLIASLGQMNIKDSLLGLLKVPALYAVLAAIIMIRMGWQLPTALERTVALAANGAIPAMLVLLGLELQRTEWSKNIRALGISTVFRLLVGPFVGLGLSALFGLNGSAHKAGVTESAMPSAVLTTVLASEYKLDSSLVTAIIFTCTLLSPFTLTPLLLYLGR
ncbi:MAG: AEC family transporter [Anaerolineales bacterium]|nr:AEC family transporter [Anaerolineales bacterium]